MAFLSAEPPGILSFFPIPIRQINIRLSAKSTGGGAGICEKSLSSCLLCDILSDVKTLAPLLILLLLLPLLTPLSKGGCPHMGIECDHGEACPVRAQVAQAAICHTGGHSGHDAAEAAAEACGGMYISCNDESVDSMNVLEIPFLVDLGSPGRRLCLVRGGRGPP